MIAVSLAVLLADVGGAWKLPARDMLLFWLWGGIAWLVSYLLALAWPEPADGGSVDGAS